MGGPNPYRPEDCRFVYDRAALFRRLRAILPHPERVITEPEALCVYETDGLAAYRQPPVAVVIPDTVDEVQRIVRLAAEMGVPVTPRGSGTCLAAGALPHPQGIVLSLARFNRIVEIDARRRLARVEPGVRNLAVTEAARPHGLYFAPDPSSQIACSIGGNVAENAGGVHCLKYGLTVHNVAAVTLITAEGERVTLGSEALDAPGYDLLALITGSEGLLGVVVEITVRLLPEPRHKEVLLAAFATVEDGGNAVAAIIGDGITPAGLEMMDNLAIRAAEDFIGAGYPVDAAAMLICELDGSPEEVADDVVRVQRTVERHGATETRTAKDADEQARFWAGRKAAFPAVGRISPDYYCMDGTIPRGRIAEVLAGIERLSREYGLRVANVFHAGDGNLHPLILYDGNVEGELERTEAMGLEILRLCVDAGGTITGEHGVGLEKIDAMCHQFSADELAQFRAVKDAFDPTGFLNPGKTIPTPSRCAEYRALDPGAPRAGTPSGGPE